MGGGGGVDIHMGCIRRFMSPRKGVEGWGISVHDHWGGYGSTSLEISTKRVNRYKQGDFRPPVLNHS